MANIHDVFDFWKSVNEIILIRMEEQAMWWDWLSPLKTQWIWSPYVPDESVL